MKTANQFAEELDQKIRRFAVASKTSPDWLELTDAERQGDPASMMFAAFWPKRWLVNVLHAYAEQETRKAQFSCGHERTLLEQAHEIDSLREELVSLMTQLVDTIPCAVTDRGSDGIWHPIREARRVLGSLLAERDALLSVVNLSHEFADFLSLAKRFHETYERLAPLFGYRTRVKSAVPWESVPEQNRALMEATCQELSVRLRTALAHPDVQRLLKEIANA